MPGLVLVSALLLAMHTSAAPGDVPLFVKDDGIWVLFYDVSSRRFGAAREAFLRGNLDDARGDLATSAGHLRLEAGHGGGELGAQLLAVAERIETLAGRLSEPDVTTAAFDPLFADAHWLLAQRFLGWAEAARDAKDAKSAGGYLWAAAHHIERTVRWSGSRLGRDEFKTLEGIRESANRLREGSQAKPFADKPVARARKLLKELGARMALH